MKRSYNTGIDTHPIELAVSVGTVGVANSIAIQRWTGGTYKILRESDAGSGNIPEFVAGTASELRCSYLTITTVIDFGHLPEAEWEQARKTTAVFYSLDGGFSGYQNFNYDTDDVVISAQGRIIVITKPIEML